MITFHDPRAESMTPAEPYSLEVDLQAGDSVGVLANGFADSERFLGHVSASLERHIPGLKVLAYAKPNASIPADDQLLDGISKECKAVVAAYGH